MGGGVDNGMGHGKGHDIFMWNLGRLWDLCCKYWGFSTSVLFNENQRVLDEACTV